MLPRIILIVLQIVVAWICADWVVQPIVRNLGVGRDYVIFVYAGVCALIVWLVGLAGGGVLKEVSTPSGGTFIVALVVALATAFALYIAQESIETALPFLRGTRVIAYPIVGAVLGYWLKR